MPYINLKYSDGEWDVRVIPDETAYNRESQGERIPYVDDAVYEAWKAHLSRIGSTDGAFGAIGIFFTVDKVSDELLGELAKRMIPPKQTNEWMAIKRYWTSDHVKGPVDKEIVESVRRSTKPWGEVLE